MNKTKLVAYIRSIVPISEAKAEEIAANFSAIVLARNEYLFEEGRVCNKYVFLEEGFLRAYTHNLKGDEVTTGFFGTNQIVFEEASFFLRKISKENIRALTDSRGWYITFDELQTLFHSIPEFREFGRGVLVKALVSLKQRTLSMINETAEERYENLLKEQPEIFQQAPLKHIASYLGITDTSLSRIRKDVARN